MSNTGLTFYDHPAWYDILHEPGTSAEARFLETINRLYGNGGRRWLEPACGTGRFVRRLALLGYRVTGYDRNTKAVEYAQQRLARMGLARDAAEVVTGNMASFCRPGEFDFAFNLINTFRHLPDDDAAMAHLRATARSLRPGGVYLLGLDLLDYDADEYGEEVWVARRGRCRLHHMMESLPPDRRRRREKIINYVTVATPSAKEVCEFTYELRSYDLAQWTRLIAASPFEVEAAYDFGGRLVQIGPGTRDVNVVLKLCGGGGGRKRRKRRR